MFQLNNLIAANFALLVVALFLVALALEALSPATALTESIGRRWWRNFGLGLVDNVANRGLGVVLSGSIAVAAAKENIGLLNLLAWSDGLAFVVGLLILDFKAWVFHWAAHHIPWLWKFHQIHHCDTNMDVSTSFRFHPVESVIAGAVTVLVILALGIPAEALVLRAVAVYAANLFSHANVTLPAGLDGALRLIVVTPGMHRIHHAPSAEDANSNYGNVFSCWDRLFSSYRRVPSAGAGSLAVGLDVLPDARALGLWDLLVLPFRRRA
ncbi:MAG TPA: sterol desaturase family protein [Pseudomonadales bacterium]